MPLAITDSAYPKLFQAFTLVSNHDENVMAAFVVPEDLIDIVDDAEAALAGLTDEEFSTLCVGAERDQIVLLTEKPFLERADRVLLNFKAHWPRWVKIRQLVVIYRTGGTENFQWKTTLIRAFTLDNIPQLEPARRDIERMGYAAKIAYLKAPLPTTYEGN